MQRHWSIKEKFVDLFLVGRQKLWPDHQFSRNSPKCCRLFVYITVTFTQIKHVLGCHLPKCFRDARTINKRNQRKEMGSYPCWKKRFNMYWGVMVHLRRMMAATASPCKRNEAKMHFALSTNNSRELLFWAPVSVNMQPAYHNTVSREDFSCSGKMWFCVWLAVFYLLISSMHLGRFRQRINFICTIGSITVRGVLLFK